MKIKRRKLEAGAPVVAMADIAFNLVLFFIILAKTQDDSHLKWEAAKSPRVEALGQSRVSVVVDKENKIWLNGQEMGVGQLTVAIQTIFDADASKGRTVLLKIHKDTLSATFEPILEAVSQAGGEIVHVLQEEKK